MVEELDENNLYYEILFEAVSNNNRETFRDLFLILHERDQQELFHLLYPENKPKIAEFLTAEEFSEIFEWMDIENQSEAVTYLPAEYIIAVFNYLPTDTLARFVFLTDHPDTNVLLKLMDQEEYARLQEVLSYAPGTAGSIMTKEYFSIYEEETAQHVIERIRSVGDRAETIYYLYVVDHRHHLTGVLSLRDLLLAQENTSVSEVMNTQVASVFVEQDQEEVANIIQDYDLLAVPVITHDGHLVGIATVDDIFDVKDFEMDEDFQEFAGISAPSETDQKITAITAAKQRAPWIIILLFLSMITGGLISFFETTLSAVVSLAIFIPLIMGAAGNVGTQSLAVAVRNLDNEEDDSPDLKEVLMLELKTGLLIGSFSGLIVFLVVTFLYQDVMLAFVVGISILYSITVAAVVGTVVPKIIKKLNFDPAVASGPFITTINDSLGLLIYFFVATLSLAFLT